MRNVSVLCALVGVSVPLLAAAPPPPASRQYSTAPAVEPDDAVRLRPADGAAAGYTTSEIALDGGFDLEVAWLGLEGFVSFGF